MKSRYSFTLTLLVLFSAAALNAQQSSSSMKQELQQQKQQLEQQEQQLEQKLQQSSSEEREQLQQQKQQLAQQKKDLETKLEQQGQQSVSQTAQSSRSEASKDELKVSESDAKQEVTDAHKASKIIGMKVMNKQNEDVGKIKDLVVDVKSGKIAYAVLSTGGMLGAGGNLIALPIESLTPMEGQKAFLVDAEKSRLSQASGFNDKDWPKIDAVKDSTVGLSPTGRTSESEREKKEKKEKKKK